MKITYRWVPALLLGLAIFPAINGCTIIGDDGQSVNIIDEMSDVEYAKWQMYISLGVKIGAGRLLQDDLVSVDDLNLAADAIELAQGSIITDGATSIIASALEEAGLTNDEVMFILLIAEQELISRGALDGYIDPNTGTLSLSPRTQEMLQIIADSLRSATVVTEGDALRGESLELEFRSGLIYVE